ncbi:hypothetical protein F4776DRAFT_667332 [Hypoxylon sp. NC0597]|nr:hypothetical protein F4776DRAFT_667332 [Hypoxylon sp. NC0597]
MANDFVGMHVRERKFTFWDDGYGYFSCTTEENTAAGLVKALTKPEETTNKYLFLSDFAVTQKQLLTTIERVQGVKFGGHLEREPGEIMNKKLGLPKRTLGQVVTNGLPTLGLL